MSSQYEPILINSDHEDGNEAENVPMSEDNSRSERTRSTDRPHFFQGGTTDSDEDPEEDPEEDPPTTNHRAPLLATSSETRPAGRQTARIRATMLNPRQWTRLRSRSPTPPPNPQPCRPPGSHIWERTLRTLERWRNGRQYTSTSQFEGSSSTRQESLLDTTPIVVDKLVRHEEKLDMIEDIVMDLPGEEALGELQYQIDNADDKISYVNSEVQGLKRRVEEMAQQFKNMDCSVNHMEHKMWDCQTMTAMALGTTQDNLREFFGKNQENGGQ